MRRGLATLVLAYGLSQFYRAFLPVLAPVLAADVGTTAQDLSFASGLWFLVFAAMQIPVGIGLDRFGPRRTAAILLACGGGGGALVFSLATAPIHISLAMALLGVGCSPVLMASYFILARNYPTRVFATLAGAIVGLGSIGNIAGTVPLAWSIGAFGWRETMAGIALLTVLVAVAIILVVRDPAQVGAQAKGSVLDLLRLWRLWPVYILMFVAYAPAAGLRGLWAGPYLADGFGADTAMIGRGTLIMGVAMIAGSFAYGPLDRIFGTRKWVAFGGNLICAAALGALAATAGQSLWMSLALLAVIGFTGMSYAMVMAHGKAAFPAHLTGRGVTLMNLFSIGGAGLFQTLSGRLHGAAIAAGNSPSQAYGMLFGFFAVILLVGLAAYLFSQDRTD